MPSTWREEYWCPRKNYYLGPEGQCIESSHTLKHYVISAHWGYYRLLIIAHNNNDNNNNKTLSEFLLGALHAISHLIFPNNTGRHYSENYFYKWENWQSEKLNNLHKYNHKIMGTRGEHNFGYANTELSTDTLLFLIRVTPHSSVFTYDFFSPWSFWNWPHIASSHSRESLFINQDWHRI